MIDRADILGLQAKLADGSVALLPTDTVYGLAAALDAPAGIDALYRLKGRDRRQPCQVLIYSPTALDEALAPLDALAAAAARVLLPGPATCLIADPTGRYAAAAGAAAGSAGIRAPRMTGPWDALATPLVATSANEPGERDPREVTDVPKRIRTAVDVVVDTGPLPGIASTVVDLREPGRATLIRPGPDPDGVAARLRALGVTVST